jgi:2-polyprenyl-3-methyl-5-hydroxy-6-metoxy-1,4-benzoquinol methylase
MKHQLLERLCCPKTGKKLTLEAAELIGDEIVNGWLVSVDGQYRYPVRNSIPRFVPEENYADNFGMQWNHFRHTQLDSYSGHPISANRFWEATGWLPDNIKGQWVLDVGCGAGRFAEVALDAGANVVALDYSSAVDACYANLKHHPNLHVVQGDIYALPFEQESFSFVYSLGVLQHTPDVAKAFAALPPMVAGEGRLSVDYYQKSWKSILHIKYWLRPVTKRIPNPVLFSILQTVVPILLPVSRFLGGIPLLGCGLQRLLPIVNYYKEFTLDKTQQEEWSLLDTFDWLSPEHDHPQTATTAREWMNEAGMKGVEVLKASHLVARGYK